MTDNLRAALERAGFDTPNDNVCGSCGHAGGDHDLGNWCLICPRPDEWDRTAKSPTGAKVDAGWCYFSSMTKEERWSRARAALASPSPEPLTPESVGKWAKDHGLRLTPDYYLAGDPDAERLLERGKAILTEVGAS